MPNLEQLMICTFHFNQDQNKILDFSWLSELKAPKLVVIWATSQKFSLAKAVGRSTRMILTLGCLRYSHGA